jgi:glutamine synthetase
MVDMALHQILPAALRYTHALCDTLTAKKNLGLPCKAEDVLLQQLSQQTDALFEAVNTLRQALESLPEDAVCTARQFHDRVIPCMNTLRTAADALETLTDKSYWPYPTYSDLLYY